MSTGQLEELIVSVRLPAAHKNGLSRLEARRSATAKAREQLIDWLSEQTSDFEVLPKASALQFTPLFVVQTYAHSLVEKLLSEAHRPPFIRAAEHKSKCKLSLPDSQEEGVN